MEWIINRNLMIILVKGVPDNRVLMMSQWPIPECELQKQGELTHQRLEVRIYRGGTEYGCQVYK